MTEKELQKIKERWNITTREIFEEMMEKQFIDIALIDIPNLIDEVERLRNTLKEIAESRMGFGGYKQISKNEFEILPCPGCESKVEIARKVLEEAEE